MRTPKFLTTIALTIAALCGVAHAQPAVDTINVQGYLQKANGQAVTNGTYHIAFGVEQNGTYIWGTEQDLAVTNGLFSASLSGTGQNLSSLPAGSIINSNFSAATLNPALLMAAGAGEISVHVYTVDAIDGNTGLNFDIPIGAVPTAYVAGVAQTVAPGSINFASLASAAVAPTTGTGTSNQVVVLNSSGVINTSYLPVLSTTGGVPNGGTGSTSGSITGTGSVTYQSANGDTTTVGNTSGVANLILQSGTGGITETVTGTSGDVDFSAGTATGNINMTPGTTSGTVTIGSAGSSGNGAFGNGGGASTTTISSGTGGISLAPATGGLVRISQGGVNLINGLGSVTVNAPTGITLLDSYNFTLPITGGTSGQFLTTDGTGTTSWSGIVSLNPTGALTLGNAATTQVNMIPNGGISMNPTGVLTLGGAATTGATLSPAGAVGISPSAGGVVMNPTGSLQLGGASTTSATFSPSGTVTIAPTGALTLAGATNSVSNGLALMGSTSGAITISAAATTTSYGVLFPGAQGAGVLSNDGNGNLSWSTLSGAITTVNPTGALTIGGSATTSETIDPNGNLTVDPSGTVAINPTGVITLGGSGTTGVTIAPTSGNAPVTIAANGSGALTIGSAAGTGSVVIGNAGASSNLILQSGSSGGVGIGTTSPQGMLDVYASTSSVHSLVVNSTSGHVGIGTTSPRTALDLGTTGVVLAGNSVSITGAAVTSTVVAQATTGLVLPTVPANTTVRGHCSLIWESITTAANGPIFALVTNNAPTDLWVIAKTLSTATAVTYTTITTATTTAITGTLAGTAATTGYGTDLDFVLETGASTVAVTVDFAASTAAKQVNVEPGSSCGWLP